MYGGNSGIGSVFADAGAPNDRSTPASVAPSQRTLFRCRDDFASAAGEVLQELSDPLLRALRRPHIPAHRKIRIKPDQIAVPQVDEAGEALMLTGLDRNIGHCCEKLQDLAPGRPELVLGIDKQCVIRAGFFGDRGNIRPHRPFERTLPLLRWQAVAWEELILDHRVSKHRKQGAIIG